MKLPAYIIRNTLRHMETVMARCKADRLDNRAINALRLMRRDYTNLNKHYQQYLSTQNQQSDEQTD